MSSINFRNIFKLLRKPNYSPTLLNNKSVNYSQVHTQHDRIQEDEKNYNLIKPPRPIEQLTTEHINEVIEHQPHLKNYNPKLFENTYNILSNEGFSTISFIQIVKTQPSLLNRTIDQITHTLEIFRSCQFGDQKVRQLLEQYPKLFEYKDENQLGIRCAHLRVYAQTSNNIWRIFMNAPNVITDRQCEIDKKIAYIKNVMKADVSDVVKSTVFSHSMDSIQCRHVFLDRLGLYKPRSPKADPLEPNKNPRMHQIYDTNDKDFAHKICGVTIDEFEVFEQLFNVELEKRDNNWQNEQE